MSEGKYIVCPACGEEGKLYAKRVKSREGEERVYYYVHHWDPETKSYRRCYLGPEEYRYVSQTHRELGEGFAFAGMLHGERLTPYLKVMADTAVRLLKRCYEVERSGEDEILARLPESVAAALVKARVVWPTSSWCRKNVPVIRTAVVEVLSALARAALEDPLILKQLSDVPGAPEAIGELARRVARRGGEL